ncbi:MAG: metal ABC transporter substrate-binding protein [Nitrospirota bacterium]
MRQPGPLPWALIVLATLLTIGRPASGEPLRVVATLPVLADFVRAVGGDAVTVTSLITGLESEHTYTPKPSDVETVRRAAVLVKVGLGLEVWVNGLIANAENSRLIVVDTSQGIGLMRGGEHDHPDDKDALPRAEERRSGGNPHVWLDPENAQTMVRHVTDGLIKADPARKKAYLVNQADYLKQLDELTRTLKARFEALPNRKIITHHAAWPYFARRFDLRIRGEIFSQIGAEPSAKRLADLIRLIRKENIRVIVSEPQLSPKIPDSLAQETGAKVVILTPLPGALPGTDDYLSMMRYNASALLEALR